MADSDKGTETDSEEVLTQEEIDALLTSVEDDDGSEADSGTIVPGIGHVRAFDFSRQGQSLSAGLPLLNVIHERFALQLCESIFNTLRCSNNVKFVGARGASFTDYLHTLELPTHINFINLKPLKGIALAVFDNNLITNATSSFFGGSMKQEVAAEKQDFTPSEMRIGNMLLQRVMSDLQVSWKADIEVHPETRQTETNPDFAQLMNPAEQLLVNRFDIVFEGTQGIFELAMPMAMIEPYREQFSVTYQAEKREDQGTWAPVIIDELKATSVELSSTLGTAQLSLGEVLKLNAGDIIPMEMSDTVTLYAEGVPIFDGEYGAFNDNNAIKIRNKKHRP
ncbi:MAG: flagellar motor switch protein FliM [Gammaproteobacteria bacterium]|nr:flagellar motor switch protein FliM [Gammaproteobacteria bacterium]MBQ0839544.1 flagellar motor switch protein FliM [Gammaproteobacteria bacterium]